MLHRILWEECADLVRACREHPFVRGLGDGSLPVEAFRRYVAQDAWFLRGFSRAYALLSARVVETEAAASLVELQRGALDELELHARYAERWRVDLDRAVPFPETHAYCDFLLRCAWHEGVGTTLAAMTPCMRLYHHLGCELAKGGDTGHDYADWIETYGADGFGELAARIESLLDRFATDEPPVHDAYRYAMSCELAFFSAPLRDAL